MDVWIDNYYKLLESKKENISNSDFRFYSIGRLPLLAMKTKEFSEECEKCKTQLNDLMELAESLPECLDRPDQRKSFEETKNSIEIHLKRVHRVKPAQYYYSLYTLFGALIGIVVGLTLSFLVHRQINVNIPLIFFAIGLLSGQIIGKKADKKSYGEKLQI